VKLHTLLDVKISIPVFVHFTSASVHDIGWLDELIYETEGYYIMDFGYIDFERLSNIDKLMPFLLSELKISFSLPESHPIKSTSRQD
jgi:hypothetical protein